MEEQQRLKEVMLELIEKNEQMQLSSTDEVLEKLIVHLQSPK